MRRNSLPSLPFLPNLRYYGIPRRCETGVAVVALISGWRPLPRLHIPIEFVVTPPKRGTRYYSPQRCALFAAQRGAQGSFFG